MLVVVVRGRQTATMVVVAQRSMPPSPELSARVTHKNNLPRTAHSPYTHTKDRVPTNNRHNKRGWVEEGAN